MVSLRFNGDASVDGFNQNNITYFFSLSVHHWMHEHRPLHSVMQSCHVTLQRETGRDRKREFLSQL